MINFFAQLKPSVYACVISLVIHALTSFIVLFYSHNLFIKAILFLLIIASLIFSLRIYCLKTVNSIRTLRFNQTSGLMISFNASHFQAADILANSYLTPYFILLNIKIENKKLTQLIALDMLSRPDFKQLLMILRSQKSTKQP